MINNIRLRLKYVLIVSAIALLVMSCIGVSFTVSSSSAFASVSSQSQVPAELLASEHRQSLKNANYQQGQLELVAKVAGIKTQKEKQVAKMNKVEKVKQESEAKKPETTTKTANTVKPSVSLEDAIRNFLGDEVGKVGLVYYDISSGSMISINKDKKFTAASTIKVPLAMIIYDRILSGTLKATDTIKFEEICREGGTGILQGKDLSSPIEVSTLVADCIKYSDNIAANMLITSMNFEEFKNKEDIKLGITTNHDNNEITAFGAFNALKKLNDGANSGNKGYSTIISLMKQTIFNDRISKDIPNSLVAHKIGNYGSNVHDVGIIYTKRPYILSIYTNGLRDSDYTISGISDIIYKRQLN